jgi:hypothetical protein
MWRVEGMVLGRKRDRGRLIRERGREEGRKGNICHIIGADASVIGDW